MVGSLQQYFNLYQFPTGRRLFAMRQVAEVAREAGVPQIAELAQSAVKQDLKTAELEAAWRRSRAKTEGKRKRANDLDGQLDRTLGGMARQLGALVHTFGDQPIGPRASALLGHLFPEGAAAITTMSYENELAASEVILEDLTGPHANDAAALNLAPFVERLRTLLPEFRESLKQETTREVSYDEVRQARATGQETMLRVVAKILGDFPGSSAEDVQTRQSLLGPAMNQNRRIAEAFSRRRPVGDVNPETGEEEPEPEGSTPAPAEV